VVLTTTFGRTAFKYAERAYRYVCMDAGHVAYNLATGAASLGWQTPMIARFDDRAVNTVLGLDPAAEAALLIMPITRAAVPTDEARYVSDAPASEPESFIALMQGGTSLRRAGARGDYIPRVRNLPAAAPDDILLPAPATGDGVFASAQRRRSVRNYSDAPLSLDDLSSLFLAAAAEREEGPAADPLLAESAPLGLYAVVNDVTDVTAGVYQYLPGAHAMRLLREGDFSQEVQAACLAQEFCGTADVVFVKTVQWDELVVPDGDRGYRYASLRAGVLGGGLYLQGTALGIGVCGVGAFTDPDIAHIIGLDPEVEVPLYVTAVGR
jgi:SagB-type dehydrogenase family enzyme